MSVSHRRRVRAAAVALALCTAATMSGCVRFDTPPPPHPTLDAVQQVRQDTAVASATIAEAAQRTSAGAEGDVAAVLTRIAEQAGAQEDQLGGVWVAWPDGAPQGVPTPAPAVTEAPGVTDAHGVLQLLVEDWQRLRDQVVWVAPEERAGGNPGLGEESAPDEESAVPEEVTSARPDPALAGTGRPDPQRPGEVSQDTATTLDATTLDATTLDATTLDAQDAALYSSLATSRAAQVTALALVLGVPAPQVIDPASDPLAVGEDATAPAYFPGIPDADAIQILDSARFALETAAPRLDSPQREESRRSAERARLAAQRVVDRGVGDSRRAAYANGDPAEFSGDAEMARAALAQVQALHLYAIEHSDPADRAPLVDGAARAAIAQVVLGGGLSEEPLPGIALAERE